MKTRIGLTGGLILALMGDVMAFLTPLPMKPTKLPMARTRGRCQLFSGNEASGESLIIHHYSSSSCCGCGCGGGGGNSGGGDW